MKRTNLTIGLLLLFVAAAVAVYTTDLPGEAGGERAASGSAANSRGLPQSAPQKIQRPSKSARLLTQPRPSLIESLGIAPVIDHPAIAAQAERIQRGTRNRLEELSDELALSGLQQLEIFPLLARSHPDYNQSVRLVGVPSAPFDPLSKRAAEKQISKFLDPDQQLDLEIMSLEAEAWWSDVISALERDLNESTKPLTPGRVPDHDPTPPDDEPPAPAAIPAPASRAERGNLFDVLQN